ncbi:MAG TPA: hypothetical protein VHA13_05375 [Gammaproteobacteria bacterium]|nr:hypothetical protein [Gammaproteobacteria bacterium]
MLSGTIQSVTSDENTTSLAEQKGIAIPFVSPQNRYSPRVFSHPITKSKYTHDEVGYILAQLKEITNRNDWTKPTSDHPYFSLSMKSSIEADMLSAALEQTKAVTAITDKLPDESGYTIKVSIIRSDLLMLPPSPKFLSL